MGKIKVSVKSVETANQVIEYWKEIAVALEIVIDEKENIATDNSDVYLENFNFDEHGSIHEHSHP